MKKLFIGLFLLILLSGCDVTVNNYEVDGYTENCKDHKGLQSINNFFQSGVCNDGTVVNWGKVKL